MSAPDPRDEHRRPSRRNHPTTLALGVVLLAGVGLATLGAPEDVANTVGTAVGVALVAPAGGGALTAADGFVPRGQSLSASADVEAVAKLEPALRQAVRDAARDAAADGVDLRVTSGWRSAAYQRELFADAVVEHGSVDAARRFVLPPERSAHVSGRAVDVGPTDATSWLAQHSTDYGLCQVYANESWHYELLVERGGTCPAPLSDASAG